MIKRNKWSSDDTINLVGHRQSVCASDFCNDFLGEYRFGNFMRKSLFESDAALTKFVDD